MTLSTSAIKRLHVFTHGMAGKVGVVIAQTVNKEIEPLLSLSTPIGKNTSNTKASYLAIEAGLSFAIQTHHEHVDIINDNKDVVNQLNWNAYDMVDTDCRKTFEQCKLMSDAIMDHRWVHTRFNYNKAAIEAALSTSTYTRQHHAYLQDDTSYDPYITHIVHLVYADYDNTFKKG